jgi:hypothetical protein
MRSLRPFLRRRVWAGGIAATLAVAVHLTRPSPPPRTLPGLAEMLGQGANGVVLPEDIAWEPSGGSLADTFRGRRVLFLSAPEAGEPRDLYRARVRLTVDGKPISVRQARNLTETPLGDDSALRVHRGKAVFATVAYGRIQGITVLDLHGIRPADRPPGWFHRLLHGITALQQTGSWVGIGRTDIVLDLPARKAVLDLGADVLRIDMGGEGRNLVYEVDERVLSSPRGGPAYAARAVPQIHPPKPLILWGVDTVRAEIGPGPITWLENQVFGVRDAYRRTAYNLFTSSDQAVLGSEPELAFPAPDDEPPVAELVWPPPPIPSLWKEQKPGEGEWQPVTHPFLKPLPGARESGADAPPYFYQTFYRPDPKRPYAEAMVIAMDMRQLELNMQAGFEDPKPLTGPAGEGRLPRDQALLSRVVATFNGAFKTTHGKYGMMVDRRVLIPPVPGAATVIVTEQAETGLGSWPQSESIPEDLVSFRQNLDPLVEDGIANPTGRYVWGWQLQGTSVMTQRTALCVTPAGHLFYVWAEEIDGPTLGRALRQAGCSYGIHLDMNPGHCGFVFTDIVDVEKKQFTLKKAHKEMAIAPDKYVRWSSKDFFYVMVRDPVPRDPSGILWEPDAGSHPEPRWMPGIFSGKLTVGNLEVELTSFEKERVDWRVRAGAGEPTTLGAPPKKLELSSSDKQRALAAIGLGHTTETTRYGLAFDGKPSLALSSGYATVILVPRGPPRIEPPGRQVALAPHEEAVQLPLLAEDAQLTKHARDHGAMRLRGAMCVTAEGRVLLARARHDSSGPVASALLRIGCKRVVELDRSSRHPLFVHRAGTATPPVGAYESSVIYALGRPMQPHAFRWKAEGATPSTTPTGFDVPKSVIENLRKQKLAPPPDTD